MSGIFGSSVEDRHFEAKLNQHLAAYDKAERLENEVEARMNDLLNNERAFYEMDEDYEIVHAHLWQVMRALRSLDKACRGDQVSIDAVLSSLSIIQQKIKDTIEFKIESET